MVLGDNDLLNEAIEPTSRARPQTESVLPRMGSQQSSTQGESDYTLISTLQRMEWLLLICYNVVACESAESTGKIA